ncbi:hypothetical protein [Nocardioides mesophilus]|uniref:Uncharacterized protein n=1 Tax=Nocardioides mesophilus TaxID=433659 RepID=A0A7G9RCX9_9ACTN|nr:hypothetical protein [Nocardioides mesophilus]QNN53454.1 hypothetical protein H9L09_03120 [Nocardioides mesophilus]
MTDEHHRIDINWVQASAGALAAVSSAVLLSTIGVAGTIIGAALGSVAATVGSSVYSHYLRVSRDRVAAAALARARVRRAQTHLGEAAADLAQDRPRAEDRLDAAEQQLQRAELTLEDTGDPDPRATWRETLRGLPWRRLLVAAAALFVTAMVIIVGFEIITGRAVSSYTGGTDSNGPRTSVPGLVGGDSRPEPSPSPTPSPTPSVSTERPTATPTPTPEATPSEAQTSPTPTPSLSASQSGVPSPTATSATPSAVPTPAATARFTPSR